MDPSSSGSCSYGEAIFYQAGNKEFLFSVAYFFPLYKVQVPKELALKRSVAVSSSS